jgi:integral membrane protein (TIGR00529 family)
MEFFAAFLPFIKISAAFILMLAGMRNKIGLALSILLGGLFMGLVFGLDLKGLASTGLLALTREKFLFLITIVGLIMVLSDGLERSGQSTRLMDSLSGYLTSPRIRLIFFPALIGLLPMPGGAIFSAPMVKAMGEKMALKGEEQAVINYWFRHVWELAWPLYPGVILTVALANIPIGSLISKTWPAVIALLFFGWFFLLRPVVPHSKTARSSAPSQRGDIMDAIREGLPLLIAIAGAIGCETVLAAWFPGISFEWGVIAALLAAVAAIMVQNGLGLDFLGKVTMKKSLWAMLAVVAAIFVFKDIMQAAGIVEEMATAAGSGVALFAATVFLPFLVGMVAGINVAFVGATFPLLLGILHNLGMQEFLIPYLVAASCAGFTGVMISPIHICFVLTCNYFDSDLARVWRKLLAPSFSFACFGTVLFLALRYF